MPYIIDETKQLWEIRICAIATVYKMEALDLSLKMLGRRFNDKGFLEYGFRTSSGNDYWCKQYELHTIMGRVTRIRLWHFFRDWEKEQGKTESECTNYEDFKPMLAKKNWPAGFDPGDVPYQY